MTKKPANPVKPSDVDAFATLVHEWQQRLNLMDWRIVQSPKRSRGSCAEVSRRDLAARLATYRIGENFGAEPVTELTIERTVVHELLHVFLYELVETARDPHASEDALEAAEHRVVNVLEKLLVPEN